MKKVFALTLSLILLLSFVAFGAFASDDTKADQRELGGYGQLHYFLGTPIEPTKVPDTTDGKVSESEYAISYEFDMSASKDVFSIEEYKGYTDTEGVKIYMSYDEDNYYLAIEVKDGVYAPEHDYFMINIGAMDGGRTVDGVSRIRYDFKGDASNGVLSGANVKTAISTFWKNDDGSWATAPSVIFDEHVGDRSLSWNEADGIITLEAAFKIQPILDYWNNENELEDARLYFFPLINMGGDSAKGASDGPLYQGRIAHYFDTSRDSQIKLDFTIDHPDISYWFNWAAHIVHFCDEPIPTTEPPTTPAPTCLEHDCTTKVTKLESSPLTTAATTTVDAATAGDKNEVPSDVSNGGCAGAVSITASVILPICALALLGKKRED